MTRFRAGVDIGGTFTDVVFLGDDGAVKVVKVASTPDDYSRAVIDGLARGIDELGIGPQDIYELGHGFTVATNAILEGKGEPTALVTTAGFRDVLELTRIRTPRLYDLYYQKPRPLVERRLRLEVRERVSFEGEVLLPLDEDDVDAVVGTVASEGIRSVAVSLLHSYANPDHERRIADAFRQALPEVNLSISSELLPEMREYERTSTTVINGYVRPVVEEYLLRLGEELRGMGVGVPVTVMQSNGGLIPLEIATEKPMYCIESGPAAGVVGAFHLGRRLDERDLMTFDMGGTTAKASIIEGGEMLLAPEYEVGGGMNAGHRLLRGSGYILRVPAIDIAEVSAGGGSVAWVDRAGGLQAGPHSAGAVPGPVCYGAGGEEPTVTDANVVLGYLNPDYLLGGAFPIEAGRAMAAIEDRVAGPAGMTGIQAAWGIHVLVNSNMGRALRAVSSERGRDPRRFSLMAFGGGGPIHSAGLAETLGISRIIVPPSPGVFSAFGLLFADVEHHFVRTHFKRLADVDLNEANGILDELEAEGRRLLLAEGFDGPLQQIQTQLDVKYAGQTSDLTINMPAARFSDESLPTITEIFMREHDRTYGYRVDEPLQLVGIRVIARGTSERPRVPDSVSLDGSATRTPGDRSVYFGSGLGWIDTPVVDRPALGGGRTTGPLIVEEYDSTTIVPPKWTASLDAMSNIVLERGA